MRRYYRSPDFQEVRELTYWVTGRNCPDRRKNKCTVEAVLVCLGLERRSQKSDG